MTDVAILREIRGAIKEGETEKVVQLLRADPARLALTTVFGSWLHVAASAGKIDVVKALVEMGADINKRAGIFDAAPIKEAASDGRLDVVDYLLSAGAEMDMSSPKRNPLFGAVYGGHLYVVERLVNEGIDITVKYSGEAMTDMDALDYAKELGKTSIARFLAGRLAPPLDSPDHRFKPCLSSRYR